MARRDRELRRAAGEGLERRIDARMYRTMKRPLPAGRLSPTEAFVFGTGLSIVGLVYLFATVHPAAGVVAAITMVSYVLIYTPLKTRTVWNTVIGAVPGALPPVIGWTAARDSLSQGAWVLFGILFLWQLPHFLAIAWMYRDDYARAGFPMLPVVEPDGRSTARQAVIYSAALLPLSLAPTLIGMSGAVYFAGALALTLAFLFVAINFGRTRRVADARRLFFASILYLPLIWVLMIADRV